MPGSLFNPVCSGASPLLLLGLCFAFPGSSPGQPDPEVQGGRAAGDTGALRVTQGAPQHRRGCCQGLLLQGSTQTLPTFPLSTGREEPWHGTAQHEPGWLAQKPPKSCHCWLLWESAHCSLGRGLLWVARDTMSLSLGFFSFHHTAKYPRKPVRLGSTQQHPGLLSIQG